METKNEVVELPELIQVALDCGIKIDTFYDNVDGDNYQTKRYKIAPSILKFAIAVTAGQSAEIARLKEFHKEVLADLDIRIDYQAERIKLLEGYLHNAQVGVNTVMYCYTKRPEAFAEALTRLQEDMQSALGNGEASGEKKV